MAGLLLMAVMVGGASDAAMVKNPHGSLDLDCAVCHTEDSWRTLKKSTDFHHNSTGFPLAGLHKFVACGDCHENLNFAFVGTQCLDCHDDFHKGRVGPTCDDCHSPAGWVAQEDEMRRRHLATAFPLVGAHERLDCDACHREPLGADYVNTPSDCYYCHADQYRETTNPPHSESGLGTDCLTCHAFFATTWGAGDFIHTESFRLSGGHGGLDCAACHISGFTNVATDCASCHLDNYNATTDPNHVAGGFPLDCAQCHNTNGWDGAEVDHNLTAFPLTGSHTAVDCAQCHTTGYTGTPTDCQSCHLDNYNATTDPDHVGSSFPLDCAQCHDTNGWDGAEVDHNLTAFPLTGSHASVDCAQCHTSGYTGTATDCQSCHLDNYNTTTDPDHVGGSFPLDCAQCHDTNGWDGAEVDHNLTAFPLTGGHTAVDCAQCHTSGYTGTSTDCQSCHLDNYNATVDPNHAVENFPLDCTGCHDTTGWQPATFNHSQTAFPLTGSHTAVDCAQCHTSGYTGTPTDCQSCHLDNYNATVDPNHSVENFPLDCTGCHDTTGWQPATFNHSQTAFPLTGSHTVVDCAQCHTAGYTGTATDCQSCHLDNYNATVDPNHSVENFPLDCTGCHSTTSWQPATFNHSQTAFPLTGSHTVVDCAQCHTSGYTGTPTDCQSCHLENYNAANDPNHAAAGFPLDCQSCHGTNDWVPSTFDHNGFFPITSGKHQGVWNNCADCHVVATDFSQFECILCHEHNRTDTDKDHSEVSQYVYQSLACYTCHPRGDAD